MNISAKFLDRTYIGIIVKTVLLYIIHIYDVIVLDLDNLYTIGSWYNNMRCGDLNKRIDLHTVTVTG